MERIGHDTFVDVRWLLRSHVRAKCKLSVWTLFTLQQQKQRLTTVIISSKDQSWSLSSASTSTL